MVEPGFVVDAVGQLSKQHEILRPQIELALWPAEVEALILAQAASAYLRECRRRSLLGGSTRSRNGGAPPCPSSGSTRVRPDQRLTGIQPDWGQIRVWPIERLAEGLDRLPGDRRP